MVSSICRATSLQCHSMSVHDRPDDGFRTLLRGQSVRFDAQIIADPPAPSVPIAPPTAFHIGRPWQYSAPGKHPAGQVPPVILLQKALADHLLKQVVGDDIELAVVPILQRLDDGGLAGGGHAVEETDLTLLYAPPS